MKFKFKIYQANIKTPYVFRGYEYAKKELNIDDYIKVYESKRDSSGDVNHDLEQLFIEFNCRHPGDYHARSMSTSDIIEYNGERYYCDSIGFVRI